MANVKIDIASEFTGAKAFKKAEKQTSLLESSVKRLGAAMAATFSAQAVINFGKKSVTAFIEAEKSNANLAKTVDNLGLSFAQANISNFLDDISAKSGIAGELLNEAFKPLLTTTGEVLTSQELMTQALDISAGSGVDLVTVTQDLAQAYLGNVKGLKKYNLGLSQQELKTKSFTQVQKLLNQQFTGANAAYLETYAGKMQVLNEAAGAAQETIGKGLLTALSALASDGTVQGLADDMQEAATAAANVAVGISEILNQLDQATGNQGLFDLSNLLQLVIEAATHGTWGNTVGVLENLGNAAQNAQLGNPSVVMFLQDMANLTASMTAATKKTTKAIKENTTELKRQSLTKKQQSIFDMEMIQRIAALKGNLSDEEEKRVKLQLALLTENEAEAKKLTAEIANSIDATGNLAKYLSTLPDAKNPFVGWKGFLDEIELQAMRIAALNAGKSETGAPTRKLPPVIGISAPVPTTNAEAIAAGNEVTGFNRFGVETKGNQTIQIDLHVDGKQIAQVLQDASMSGNQVYVNRITGGFYQ